MKASKFDKLTDEQLNAMKELPLVIARCSPQSKAKLIKALHMRDRRAAMTGDGVNDAPAIKCADIGIAMGASGSDVTVEASDIVLTTDNFSTIVEAISEGRRIFANIRKFVIHLLSANTAQLFALLIPVLIGYKVPLTATQILWLNMITGTPPAIGLGIEKGARKIMKRPPATGLFTNETNLDILFYGMLMAAITLVSFFTVTDLWLHKSLTSAQGVAFTSLTIMLLLHAYNCRHSRKSFFMEGCAKSWLLHGAVIFGLVMQCLVLYIPWLNTEVFKVHPLAPAEWLLVACGGLAFMLTAEAYKLTKRAVLATIKRRREKKSRKNILVASVQEISLV
jgi:magnesium-transporting ATPase (P-type)